MVYKTTSTTDFNLDLNSLVEEAFERTGNELRTGYELKTARRSLNLMLLDWANRGINLWTIDQGSIPMVASTAAYDLPVDTVDLMEHVIRTGTGTGQLDINISRISASTYSTIPTKNATGRPIQVWVNRKTGTTNSSSVVQYPQIYVWPTPDVSNLYTFVYWRLRRMQDGGDGINGQDVPFRFLPALVSGLAFHLSIKLPNADPTRTMGLKQMYDEDFQRASDEDREKAPLRLVPRMYHG